uniref:Uncharacterized protein n=1 Tax=Octopus bimaculoides TaxID=37653 RepID=A0A0L8G1A5_OCTBM
MTVSMRPWKRLDARIRWFSLMLPVTSAMVAFNESLMLWSCWLVSLLMTSQM